MATPAHAAHRRHRDTTGFLKRFVAAADRSQRDRPWLAFPYGVVKKFGDDEAGNLAALVAYYGFFSLFPLLLLLVTVLGFLLKGSPHLQQRVLSSTLAQFPVIGDQLRTNVHSLKASGIGVVVGVLGLAWGGMGALQAMQTAMNDVWNVPRRDRATFVKAKLRALLMLAVLGVGTIATTVLAAIGSAGMHTWPVRVAGIALSLIVDFGLFLLSFQVLTEADTRWRDHIPGAAVASVGWAVLQLIGGYYVGHQLQGASQTYGLFAVVIGLLSWMYLQAQLTMLAAEVNVVRARKLWPRALREDNITDADKRALALYADTEERIVQEDVHIDLSAPNAASDCDGMAREEGKHFVGR